MVPKTVTKRNWFLQHLSYISIVNKTFYLVIYLPAPNGSRYEVEKNVFFMIETLFLYMFLFSVHLLFSSLFHIILNGLLERVQ